MKRISKEYVAPVIIIVVGLGWLLNVKDVLPSVDWIWTCGLALGGILVLAVGGIDKLTATVGPFLIIASVCSVLRQTGHLDVKTEVPILTIVLGTFLLLVQVMHLPRPKLLEILDDDKDKPKSDEEKKDGE